MIVDLLVLGLSICVPSENYLSTGFLHLTLVVDDPRIAGHFLNNLCTAQGQTGHIPFVSVATVDLCVFGKQSLY